MSSPGPSWRPRPLQWGRSGGSPTRGAISPPNTVCTAVIGAVRLYSPAPRHEIAESGTGRDAAKRHNQKKTSRPFGLGRALESTIFAPKANCIPFAARVRLMRSVKERRTFLTCAPRPGPIWDPPPGPIPLGDLDLYPLPLQVFTRAAEVH